jgi:hypothetical protein
VKNGHGSIPRYVAVFRQNAEKQAMIGEARVLGNCGYGTPICQTLNRGEKRTRNYFNL